MFIHRDMNYKIKQLISLKNVKSGNTSYNNQIHLTTLLGDSNERHPRWEPTKNPLQNSCSKTLHTIRNNNDNLCLATPFDPPTYLNGYTGATSTIDSIFCFHHYFPLTKTLAMVDLGSNHTAILSKIEIIPEKQQIGRESRGTCGGSEHGYT